MRFVHMVGWTNTIIPDAQFCAHFGWQFNRYAWFGCIELHKQKPFAEYSPRDPVLREQFFRYLGIDTQCKFSDLFYIHNITQIRPASLVKIEG